MPDKILKVYLGNLTLNVTQSECKKSQQNETGNLIGIKPAMHVKADETETKVNVVEFELIDDGDVGSIFVDLRLIDVSTPTGVADGIAMLATHKLLFDCKAHVQNIVKDVKVFRKKP